MKNLRLFRKASFAEESKCQCVDGLQRGRWKPKYSVRGYTSGMKTAVSVPDDVFEKIERIARRSRRSRSEVFSAALREYAARHTPDEVTEAMNAVVDQLGAEMDPVVAEAAKRVLDNSEW